LLEHLLEAILLGIIQGIAEWLPISSTGHLRLAEYFMNIQVPILFDVTLHIGTLAVILLFFRKDVKQIFTDFLNLGIKSENGRLVPLIIVGTIPTALIGLAFSDLIESTFRSPMPIAAVLTVCGILLYSSKLSKEKTDTITYKTALVFGTAQGIAIIPGLSRSGTTIAIALLLGLKREKAFKFSFLLSIPAIIGALGLTLIKEHETLAQSGFGLPEILVGAIAATIVGYFALRLVHKTLENRKFHLFAFYCWLAGITLILLSLTGF